MGYMDISICGSDRASDLNETIKRCSGGKFVAIAILQKELKEVYNCYNTQGCVNVALVLTEGAGKKLFADYKDERYEQLVSSTLEAMGHLRKFSFMAEWDTEENKKKHLDVYDRLISQLTSLKHDLSS